MKDIVLRRLKVHSAPYFGAKWHNKRDVFKGRCNGFTWEELDAKNALDAALYILAEEGHVSVMYDETGRILKVRLSKSECEKAKEQSNSDHAAISNGW